MLSTAVLTIEDMIHLLGMDLLTSLHNKSIRIASMSSEIGKFITVSKVEDHIDYIGRSPF